jgi:hypothetical protein
VLRHLGCSASSSTTAVEAMTGAPPDAAQAVQADAAPFDAPPSTDAAPLHPGGRHAGQPAQREMGMRTAWVTQYLTIGDTAGLAHPQKG